MSKTKPHKISFSDELTAAVQKSKTPPATPSKAAGFLRCLSDEACAQCAESIMQICNSSKEDVLLAYDKAQAFSKLELKEFAWQLRQLLVEYRAGANLPAIFQQMEDLRKKITDKMHLEKPKWRADGHGTNATTIDDWFAVQKHNDQKRAAFVMDTEKLNHALDQYDGSLEQLYVAHYSAKARMHAATLFWILVLWQDSGKTLFECTKSMWREHAAELYDDPLLFVLLSQVTSLYCLDDAGAEHFLNNFGGVLDGMPQERRNPIVIDLWHKLKETDKSLTQRTTCAMILLKYILQESSYGFIGHNRLAILTDIVGMAHENLKLAEDIVKTLNSSVSFFSEAPSRHEITIATLILQVYLATPAALTAEDWADLLKNAVNVCLVTKHPDIAWEAPSLLEVTERALIFFLTDPHIDTEIVKNIARSLNYTFKETLRNAMPDTTLRLHRLQKCLVQPAAEGKELRLDDHGTLPKLQHCKTYEEYIERYYQGDETIIKYLFQFASLDDKNFEFWLGQLPRLSASEKLDLVARYSSLDQQSQAKTDSDGLRRELEQRVVARKKLFLKLAKARDEAALK